MTERFRGRMMRGMERFLDDDRGSLDWLAHHPDGFLINTGCTKCASVMLEFGARYGLRLKVR
jgi:hypothetical protein